MVQDMHIAFLGPDGEKYLFQKIESADGKLTYRNGTKVKVIPNSHLLKLVFFGSSPEVQKKIMEIPAERMSREDDYNGFREGLSEALRKYTLQVESFKAGRQHYRYRSPPMFYIDQLEALASAHFPSENSEKGQQILFKFY